MILQEFASINILRVRIMKIMEFDIQHIPAALYGEQSERVYLFLHGKGGCKEEAGDFAETVCPRGWQVLSIDLPERIDFA